MTAEQALRNLKQLLDVGIQKGLFKSAEEVVAVTESYNTVTEIVAQSLATKQAQKQPSIPQLADPEPAEAN